MIVRVDGASSEAPEPGSPEPATPEAASPHSWVRVCAFSFVPGQSNPFLDRFSANLAAAATELGHAVDDPSDRTDALVTTARYGEAISWRHSVLFTGRAKFGLSVQPPLFTIVHIEPDDLQRQLQHFSKALEHPEPRPVDFQFDGLAEHAHDVLYTQGRRGGPMMSVARVAQAQSKSLRVLLVVGHDKPEACYLVDLAGAYPRIENRGDAAFYQELIQRMSTALSTREIAQHDVTGEQVTRAAWESLDTPRAMVAVSHQLGERDFFTTKILIEDLVKVPAVSGTIARQYSEGCFSTWDPTLNALVITATGSERPVDKGQITDQDLAVVTGVLADGTGAIARPVEGLGNGAPSSEAVEFRAVDDRLPWIELAAEWNAPKPVPVVRSKLHGHRGVSAYDPRTVEYVPLAAPYFKYLVSCSTEAQAWAIEEAFALSASLQDPSDPRTVAFTVLPGHGMLAVEKWVAGAKPFEVLIDAIDSGRLQISNRVPQGPFEYCAKPNDERLYAKLPNNLEYNAPTTRHLDGANRG